MNPLIVSSICNRILWWINTTSKYLFNQLLYLHILYFKHIPQIFTSLSHFFFFFFLYQKEEWLILIHPPIKSICVLENLAACLAWQWCVHIGHQRFNWVLLYSMFCFLSCCFCSWSCITIKAWLVKYVADQCTAGVYKYHTYLYWYTYQCNHCIPNTHKKNI